ncbi:hypothetical protein [Methanosarcina barkeri]|uniref:hypothetical protein n=1 Tax=Methanosarcina barkeri TaxID=2208 RepID=UPI000AAFB45F
MKFNYNVKLYKIILIGLLVAALVVTSGCADKSTSDTNQNGSSPSETSGVSDTNKAVESGEFTLTDGYGREVTIPENVEQVVCSGAGCLRYLVYLQAQDDVVGLIAWKKRKAK